jgi:hypothetical protein
MEPLDLKVLLEVKYKVPMDLLESLESLEVKVLPEEEVLKDQQVLQELM